MPKSFGTPSVVSFPLLFFPLLVPIPSHPLYRPTTTSLEVVYWWCCKLAHPALSLSTGACTLDPSYQGVAFSEYDGEVKELDPERGKPMSSHLVKFTKDFKRSSLGHLPSSSSSAELSGGGVKRAVTGEPQTPGRLEELVGAQPSSAKLREQSEQTPIFLM
ncbi:hypothetical protein EXIGLDRAFT_697477 [Exidia glandulosa HHB12029]|uniref:Uncharacterized protein n=1 Tax=Exidia glandulosa HHB12029 TaxID=1314781 RepID=A0A165EQN0_EXIGL|nr:hypothetical protein EXIGLDRAFT_697477 [Exidia glandulosa HHB12029]